MVRLNYFKIFVFFHRTFTTKHICMFSIQAELTKVLLEQSRFTDFVGDGCLVCESFCKDRGGT